jgi:hypothetical protein
MTILLLRLLERIHGHLAWLSVAALLHPAILLRNPRKRARLSAALAALLTVLTAALGALIYPDYREQIRQHLFRDAPRIGWMFERKEHLAVGATGLALAGAIAHLSLPLFEPGPVRTTVAQLAYRAFVAAFVLALTVAVLGVSVASYRSF